MIPEHVTFAFGLTGIGKKLVGGQGTSYLYDDKVIKPVDSPVYHSAVTTLWDQLMPSLYRISKPITSLNQQYVYAGYAVTQYEPGEENDGLISEKLIISRALHQDLKALNVQLLPPSDDPWTKANNVLWRGAYLPEDWNDKRTSDCRFLLDQLPKICDENQLVHCDLSGNILFHQTLLPLIIDFSPTIAPIKYAEAVLVCDSIAWAGLPLETLLLLKPLELYHPYILYAITFRMLTIAFSEGYSEQRFTNEWQNFKPIWQFMQQNEWRYSMFGENGNIKEALVTSLEASIVERKSNICDT